MSKKARRIHYAVLIVFGFLTAMPLVFAVLLSFSNNADIANGVYIPGSISFENYRRAFATQPLLKYIGNSLIAATSQTVLQTAFAVLAAYALVFIPMKGKKLIFGLFLATMMIPSEVLVLSNFQTIRGLGLLDTFRGLVLPSLASTFGIFLLRQNMMQIPKELREASRIAGQGDLGFMNKVVLPMVRNTLVTLTIYLFLVSWNSYLWPLLATTDETVRTVQIGLRFLKSMDDLTDYSMIAAGAITVALPTLLLIGFGQNKLEEGLTKGALK